MSSGFNYKTSPRCEAFDRGHQCRMRQDNHAIINGYNQHKWWGCGECADESHEWLDMAYLTADDYAARAIARLEHEFNLVVDKRILPEWAAAVKWCQELLRTMDIMSGVA